ncbi:hypothetical protein BCL32_0160 [Rhizobium mongolense USDA 1844]|uniref:Uncharacterized protein n=1 Tax=Rhizobium mongolense USDA 1844 TaxID=1079460 RepID=A0A559TJV5_9HYPH|nr:hypothetical protein BCL32_0160 [Rhizobium mongolense USDA 1844]
MARRWRIIAALGALPVVAGIAGLLLTGGASGGPPSNEPCNLIAAYGGIFEVPSGVEVEVSDDNRPGLLDRVHACVESELSDGASTRYRQMAGTLTGPDRSSTQQAERNFVEIELAAAIAGTDAAEQQRQVARRLARGQLEFDEIVKRQGAGSVLKDSSLDQDRVKYRNSVAAYQKSCVDAGVPVPGPLATDPAWNYGGELDAEADRYFFRADWNDAEVWTYRGAASGGFCVMLVRRKANKEEQYAGTICTDRLQTNACFFDNVVYDGSGTKRIGWEDFKKRDFGELVHPKDGQDFCNMCHLGNNPFIVHPGTTLGKVVKSMYAADVPNSQKFKFVGLGDEPSPWFNFDPIVPSSPGGCFTCHGLPKITSGRFCAGIVEIAANRTMPPGHWPPEPQIGAPWFWPDSNGCFSEDLAPLADYFPSLVKLQSVCSGKVEKICQAQ